MKHLILAEIRKSNASCWVAQELEKKLSCRGCWNCMAVGSSAIHLSSIAYDSDAAPGNPAPLAVGLAAGMRISLAAQESRATGSMLAAIIPAFVASLQDVLGPPLGWALTPYPPWVLSTGYHLARTHFIIVTFNYFERLEILQQFAAKSEKDGNGGK